MTRRRAWALGVFAVASRVLPRRFRREHAPGLQAFVEEQLAEADRRYGTVGVVYRLLVALLDLCRTSLIERLASLRALGGGPATLHRDVVGILRVWRRRPGSVAIAVAWLSVGVGAGSGVFMALNAVLFTPLPVGSPHELVKIEVAADGTAGTATYLDFHEWRSNPGPLSAVAGFSRSNQTVTGFGAPFRAPVTLVSAGFFETLEVEPVGRTFSAAEERAGADDVAIVSARFALQHIGASLDALGESVVLNGRRFTIVGVLPAGFRFDPDVTDIFVPLGVREIDEQRRGSRWIEVIARADGGAAAVAAVVESSFRASDGDGVAGQARVRCVDLHAFLTGASRSLIVLLLAGALVAGAAIAFSLALLSGTRAMADAREQAVRAALGATRTSLARRAVLEWLLLAVVGGGGALLVGQVIFASALRWLPGSLPDIWPMLVGAGVDGRVVALTMLLAVAVVVPAAVVAAWAIRRVSLESAIRASVRVTAGQSAQAALVALQVALAVALIVGGGLLARSLARLVSVDPGFEVADVSAFQVSLPADRYPDAPSVAAFYEALVEDVGGLPGVESAGLVDELPLTRDFGAVAVRLERTGVPPDASVEPLIRSAGPGYFDTIRARLSRGRAFTRADRADRPLVAVVSQSLARLVYGDDDPVGRPLRLVNGGLTFTVVGVVADMFYGELDGAPRPAFYTSSLQDPSRSATLVVRSSRHLDGLADDVRRRVAARDGSLPVYRVRSLAQVLWDTQAVRTRRLVLTVIGAFGVLAVFVAVSGVYSLLSRSVSQRSREIGVRLALGAEPTKVLWLIVRRGLVLAACGAALGAMLAFLASRAVEHLLFRVGVGDPLTMTAAIAGVLVLACGAAAVPGIRAARLDPIVVLRHD